MKKRYEELDSLRGIAAFSVLLGHFLLIIPDSNITKLIEFGPLRFFVASSEAVTLFFVLSGFVLTLPFYTDRNISYLSFLYKRFLRIYLPYYVSLAFVIIATLLFYKGEIEQLSDWFNNAWKSGLNLSLILNHLLLITSFSNDQLNPVLWSLVHEMRISIIFPLIMLIVKRLEWKKSLGLSIACSVLAFSLYLLFSKPNYHDYFQTIHYVAMFIIGSLLAGKKDYLISYFRTISAKQKVLLLGFGMFLYLYAKPAFALGLILGSRDPFLATILDSWFVTFGASIIIMLSLSTEKISKVLLTKPIYFLGKISYSLYLYHCIILFSLTHLLYNKLPLSIILGSSLIVSLAFAALSYYFVEIPSIKLGKKLKNKGNKKIKNKVEASA